MYLGYIFTRLGNSIQRSTGATYRPRTHQELTFTSGLHAMIHMTRSVMFERLSLVGASRLPHVKATMHTTTTGISLFSVGDKFFCAFFSVRTEKLRFFCRFQNIPTEKYENPQNNCMIFLCMTIHTRKNQRSQKNTIYSVGSLKTHRKNICTHRKIYARIG